MKRFSSLDGIRGLCALAVALFHLPIASHFYTSPLIREAYVWVDFFFVLSGFVIAHAYRERLTTPAGAGDFLIRRIGRLWPLHVAVLAVLVTLELGKTVFVHSMAGDMRPPFSGDASLSSLAANILLVHAWGIWDLASGWNVPSWSISAELLAYLVFVVVSLLLPRRLMLAAAVLFLVGLGVMIALAGDPVMAQRLFGVRAIAGFFAGVLGYGALTRTGRPDWAPWLATGLEALAAMAMLAYVMLIRLPDLSALATPLFALAVYIFAAERGLLSRALNTAPLQFLGRVSFSVYLTHGLVVAAFGGAARVLEHVLGTPVRIGAQNLFGNAAPDVTVIDFASPWLGDLATLAFIAAVVGLSAITYRCIELPGQALFARLAKASPGYRLRPAA